MKLKNILKIFKRSTIVDSSDPEGAPALDSYMKAALKNPNINANQYGFTGNTFSSTQSIKPKNYLSQLIKAKKMTDEELVKELGIFSPLDFERLDNEVLKSELLKRLAGRQIRQIEDVK